MHQEIAHKLLVLGIDGMDPHLTKRYLQEGKMPNTEKLYHAGSSREDLVLLGGMPTITPPMWTTLATGCYPYVHGITDFSRQSPQALDMTEYALNSQLCKAEPLWNVFAEAGKKTLVWHWPGSSWPPTSDSPLLHVVDGTQPGGVNAGTATVDHDFLLVASTETEVLTFRAKAATDANMPCMITDVPLDNKVSFSGLSGSERSTSRKSIILTPEDGGSKFSDMPIDLVISPISQPHGWTTNLAQDAREVIFLFSTGLIRRPALLLKDETGIFSKVALFTSKKSPEPLVILEKNVLQQNVLDEAIKGERRYRANRHMRIIELDEAGTTLKVWVSQAMDIENDTVWQPKSLFQTVVSQVGFPPPVVELGASDPKLITDCMKCSWDVCAKWQADALNYLIEKEKYDVIFSHFHNIDLQEHMFIKHLKNKGDAKLPEACYWQFLEDVYRQTDEYIGRFLHLLDEGWTIFVVSDHSLVSSDYETYGLGNCSGVNYRIMEELGYTKVKRDAQGQELYDIDWSQTKAVANRGVHIYLNLKGRDPYGIVEPEEQYELEEQIMTDLYSYKHPISGHRLVALALRNREAILLGLGGPECGDIIYFLAEGYISDHGSGLSTAEGYGGTYLGPIFMAAGQGLKKNYRTNRVIRQVDVAPTLAYLGGCLLYTSAIDAYRIVDAGIIFRQKRRSLDQTLAKQNGQLLGASRQRKAPFFRRHDRRETGVEANIGLRVVLGIIT